jgi:hypothetical protein
MFANGPLPMAMHCTHRLQATIDEVLSHGRKRSLGELADALGLDVAGTAPDDEMSNVNRHSELAALSSRAAV